MAPKDDFVEMTKTKVFYIGPHTHRIYISVNNFTLQNLVFSQKIKKKKQIW